VESREVGEPGKGPRSISYCQGTGRKKEASSLAAEAVNVCAELRIDVCRVDCIHLTKHEAEAFQQVHQLYIDLEERIDCGLPDAFSCRQTSGNVARAGMPIIGSLVIF
jgi:hypothetical protein